jgi:hypothetical protein
MAKSDRLRELATWYREYAEKAGSTAIWELRLLVAEDLERSANEIDYPASALVAGRRPPSRGMFGGLST